MDLRIIYISYFNFLIVFYTIYIGILIYLREDEPEIKEGFVCLDWYNSDLNLK